jgi:hypothetical protein
MPTDLGSPLDAFAAGVAAEIAGALHIAPAQELLASSIPRGAGPRRPFGAEAARPLLTGRVPRRSRRDILASLNMVVELVRGRESGMRSGEIRAALRMLPHEMPRVLREGVRTKRLTSEGRTRATTYFAQ